MTGDETGFEVSVLIPTFRRPDALARAARSVFAQTCRPASLIIVDNSPEAGARATVEALREQDGMDIVYVHAPESGVANARNAGFEATRTRFIAQLDDDEEAEPGWLEALLAAQALLDAPVVFGPVRANAHGSGRLKTALMTRLYSRTGPHEDRVLDAPYGCGNSLIDLSLALPDPPFDRASNEIGGEDDVLFAHLKAQGARFGWAMDATVIEHVEGKRARWRYLFARSFAYGQGPSQQCAERGPSGLAGLGFWMAVGLVQLAVFGLLTVPALAAGANRAAACLDKAAQGAGKLVWLDAVSPRFYGSAAI